MHSSPTGPVDVVLLCGPGFSSRAVFGSLRSKFPALAVILEAPVTRTELLRNRTRRFGPSKVLGQIAFIAVVPTLLRFLARQRIAAMTAEMAIPNDEIFLRSAVRVLSANAPETISALRNLAPKVVVVNGTRILTQEVLDSIPAPFINIHMGVTPLYRGTHGGYWALVEHRPDLVGTTIHYLDSGIDTGPIIHQARFSVTAADNFVTYPYLHIKSIHETLPHIVGKIVAGQLPEPLTVNLPSRIRTHPTLFEYLFHRFSRGVT